MAQKVVGYVKLQIPAGKATPISSCHRVVPGTLEGLPAQAARKAGMTSNQHGPYIRGDTRVSN